jgi:glycosyltransferase involved in cell wall biosynthesis
LELAQKVEYLLTNEDVRRELSKKGLKRASMFSWEKTAKETKEMYERAFWG